MFEKKYKADNERIEPTRESLLSLSYKMKREQAKKKDKKKAVRWIRPAAAVAAALVVLLGCFQIFRSFTPRDGQIPMAGAGAAGEAEVSQQQAQSPRLPGPGLHSPGALSITPGFTPRSRSGRKKNGKTADTSIWGFILPPSAWMEFRRRRRRTL